MGIQPLARKKSMKALLKSRIARYESRYEMCSKEMAKALSDGTERETAEKLKWMFDYHVLEYINGKTRTEGTTGRRTSTSTKRASLTMSS